ncbi:hypothetical protein BC829DRAFT_399603 [Chytridium lagenaria]|nr:hypothetical protein BC829DRAFT_399603 [Chytridium lagenaria]
MISFNDVVETVKTLPREAVLPGVSIVLYFTVLLLCFRSAGTFSRVLLALLAVVSLAVTWSAILSWLLGDIKLHLGRNGNSLAKWIIESDLFDAAYVNVAKDTANWWWSAQLLYFVITMIVFFWAEGAHRVVGIWFVSALLYTVLGFLGAISVAFPLFLIQRYLLTRSGPYTISRPESPSIFLTFCAVFGVNLKIIHVLLLAPILFSSGLTLVFWPAPHPSSSIYPRRRHRPSLRIPCRSFPLSHLGLSLDHFLKNSGTVQGLFQTWDGNPCQLSISADMIFTTVVASVFMLRELWLDQQQAGEGGVCVGCFVLLSPIVSISVTFPTFLAYRDGWRISSYNRGRKLKHN